MIRTTLVLQNDTQVVAMILVHEQSSVANTTNVDRMFLLLFHVYDGDVYDVYDDYDGDDDGDELHVHDNDSQAVYDRLHRNDDYDDDDFYY